MGLTSLLVCADAEAVQVLARNLQDLGIEVETCGDPRAAQQRIIKCAYDAVFVDCDTGVAAGELIAEVREVYRERACVVIAIAGGNNAADDMFAKGANFVLYKPISQERVAHSLRAAQGLLRSERRVQPRVPLHTSTTLDYAATENVPATLLDLNETGLGMRAQDKFPPKCRVYFQFTLPGNSTVVRLAGEVMWQDPFRRVGIRFASLPQASKKVLESWVKANLPEQNAATDSPPATGPDDLRLGLSAGLELLSASSADRRKPDRQGCNIGAQVYRAGSKTPVRCNLTDISSGGCYIETTEPFPEGTIVEIVVHTHDQKSSIDGRVRSANRGFGMGVEFLLRNDEQKAHVQKLIASSKEEPKLIG